MKVSYIEKYLSSKDANWVNSIWAKDASWDFVAVSPTDPLPTVSSPWSQTPTSSTSVISRFIAWAMFNATPTTRTEWQAWPLQSDANGNLKTDLGTRIAGEDISRGIMKVQQEFTPYAITTAGSYTVSAGPCLLGSIVVQGWTAGTIKIYDNTSATGTPVLDFDSTATIASYPINGKFSIGCFIVTSANTKVTAFIGV